jgi:hypothetical protein
MNTAARAITRAQSGRLMLAVTCNVIAPDHGPTIDSDRRTEQHDPIDKESV